MSLHAGEAVRIQTQPQQITIPPNNIKKGECFMKALIESISASCTVTFPNLG